MLTDC